MTVTSHLKYYRFSSLSLKHNNFDSSSLHQTFHHHLEKCSTMAELKLLHAQIIIHGLSNETLTIGKLIAFCAVSCTGNLRYAQFVFDQFRVPNKFMYNSLIRGYANSDCSNKAISLYVRMVSSGISPNEFTFPFVFKACSFESGYWVGVILQCQVIKLGFGCNVVVQNALVNVYVVCKFVNCARIVFDEIVEKSLVSWNSMICGYTKMGFAREVLSVFRDMKKLGVDPDEFTFVDLISVCSVTCDFDLGKCIHCCVDVTGVMSDVYVQNALIDMYSNCGDLVSAQLIFDQLRDKTVVSWTSIVAAYANHGLVEYAQKAFHQMPIKNVVSWNSMISCLVRERRFMEAFNLFLEMCETRVAPDESTFVSIFSVCTQLGNLMLGEKMYEYMRKYNIPSTTTLSNAIVEMYAKCGPIDIAMDIFLRTPNKNVVSWNVIIGGLALHGRGSEAVNAFENMKSSGICPDEITFTGLLSACCHSGLINTGRCYFRQMRSPEIEHYACMVDLLGRGGLIEEAMRLIIEMPMKADIVIWGALLGACRTHRKAEIVKHVLKQVLELAEFDSGVFVLVSNIYCEAGKWKDVKNIRKLMKDFGVKKCKGISMIEIDGNGNEFLVDDKRHCRSADIYSMLDRLTFHLKSCGYVCNISNAYVNEEET